MGQVFVIGDSLQTPPAGSALFFPSGMAFQALPGYLFDYNAKGLMSFKP